jgi:hypothetical protein
MRCSFQLPTSLESFGAPGRKIPESKELVVILFRAPDFRLAMRNVDKERQAGCRCQPLGHTKAAYRFFSNPRVKNPDPQWPFCGDPHALR